MRKRYSYILGMNKTRGPLKGSRYNGTHRYAFGRALAAERRRKGYTQEKLGRLIGTSKRVISHLEREVKNPPADTLKKLAAALRVPVDRLLYVEPATAAHTEHIDRGLSKRFEAAQKLPPSARKELKRMIDVMTRAHGITSEG